MKRIGEIRRPKAEIETFSEDEVHRMLAVYATRSSHIEARNYCILLCSYDTGIRLSELTGLKLEHVDLSRWKMG